MDEKRVQRIIKAQRADWFKITVPNIYYYAWESDLIGIMKDNTIVEFEIKCSKWDYQYDFEKIEKHNCFRYSKNLDQIPNAFYYVVLEKFAHDIEVPDYAGLIIVQMASFNYYLITKKKAPLLHKETIDPLAWERLAIKLYNKCK